MSGFVVVVDVFIWGSINEGDTIGDGGYLCGGQSRMRTVMSVYVYIYGMFPAAVVINT